MRRATAVLTLTAVLVVAAAGLASAAGASTQGFGRRYVPSAMAVYEWHQAGELPDDQVTQRLRFLRANGFRTVFLELGDYLDAAELAPGTPGRETQLVRIRHKLQRFVGLASDAGVAVQALGGGPTWTGELRYLGQELVELVAGYNRKVRWRERLQGPARHRALHPGRLVRRPGDRPGRLPDHGRRRRRDLPDGLGAV